MIDQLGSCMFGRPVALEKNWDRTIRPPSNLWKVQTATKRHETLDGRGLSFKLNLQGIGGAPGTHRRWRILWKDFVWTAFKWKYSGGSMITADRTLSTTTVDTATIDVFIPLVCHVKSIVRVAGATGGWDI